MASVVLSFSGKEIKSYELNKAAMVVGRDAGVDIVIDNLGVSRSHCQFIQRDDAFVVQDMNSANGTYVNGKRVGEHNLVDDDQIVVGKYVMTFKVAGADAGVGVASADGGAPTPNVAPAADRIVPDSLNTYMMDGNKIKERLEEMRRKETGQVEVPEQPATPAPAPQAPPPPPPPPTPTPVPVRAETQATPAEDKPRERHTRIVMGTKGPDARTIKRYLYFSLVLNLVLAVVLLFYMLQTLGLAN